jgi:hypothetical protein
MNRTALHSLQSILDDFWQQPLCFEGSRDPYCRRLANSAVTSIASLLSAMSIFF